MSLTTGPRCKIDAKFRCGKTKERYISYCPDDFCAKNVKAELKYYDSAEWKDYISGEKDRLKRLGPAKK